MRRVQLNRAIESALRPTGRAALFAAAVLLALTNSVAKAGIPIPFVDAVFADLDHTNSPGCALGVARDGEFIYRRGYGMASLEHGIPAAADTLFYAGSVTKEFVAASIVLAAEQGRLNLDDDVRKHIPELPDYGHRITVRNLIHHTSGLRDFLGLLGLAGKPSEDVLDRKDMLALIVRQKNLNFKPGTQYSYSNSGYFLLSEILYRATGLTLRQFAETNIFHPLGMNDTRFHDNRLEIVPRRAFGYQAAKNGGFEVAWSSNFEQVGGGGLITSVNDMLNWERNFLKPRIGSSSFLETIQTPDETSMGGESEGSRYAFGLVISKYRGLKTVGHGGALFGYRAAFLRFPEERFAVICLCNLATADPTTRVLRVADYFLADRLGPPTSAVPPAQRNESQKKITPIPAATLEAFAGTYHSDELSASYCFLMKEGKLVFAGNRVVPSMQLDPIGPNRFRASTPAGSLEFEFSKDNVVLDAGRVTGIRFDRLP